MLGHFGMYSDIIADLSRNEYVSELLSKRCNDCVCLSPLREEYSDDEKRNSESLKSYPIVSEANYVLERKNAAETEYFYKPAEKKYSNTAQ